jgi:hypothetical protein
VEARHVAQALIPSEEQHAPRERYFDRRDHIEAIDEQGFARELAGPEGAPCT